MAMKNTKKQHEEDAICITGEYKGETHYFHECIVETITNDPNEFLEEYTSQVPHLKSCPWGFYVTHVKLDDKSVCVKTLFINPGEQLSLQYHNKRSEFWYISDKNARYQMTLGTQCFETMGINTFTIPVGWEHTVKNLTNEVLIIHETQMGVCEPEDIIRLYDPYASQRKN